MDDDRRNRFARNASRNDNPDRPRDTNIATPDPLPQPFRILYPRGRVIDDRSKPKLYCAILFLRGKTHNKYENIVIVKVEGMYSA